MIRIHNHADIIIYYQHGMVALLMAVTESTRFHGRTESLRGDLAVKRSDRTHAGDVTKITLRAKAVTAAVVCRYYNRACW